MRVLLASDVHGAEGKLKSMLDKEGADVIVLAGDLSNGSMHQVRSVLRACREREAPVLFVPGNMDPPDLLRVETLEGCENLHLRRIEVLGFTFGGVGGGNISPFGTPIELGEEELWEGLSELSEVDVLVVHAPPYRTKLDVIRSGVHVGSKSIRRFIEEEQPLLCVCGHIHESPSVDRIGKTVVVNAGPLVWGRYAIIEVADQEVRPMLKKLG
ncbi:MAG: metallophosphoesterase family protein [Candidatus Korarchaeota archaeon]|nr:metallophosphoesterase family protein [Candidatus Korarchaeota archaeon]